MDYCTYGHMIDNVVLIVTGTLHERDVQVWGGQLTSSAEPHAASYVQSPVLAAYPCPSLDAGAAGQVPPAGHV